MFMDEDDIVPLPDDIFDEAEREKQNCVSTQRASLGVVGVGGEIVIDGNGAESNNMNNAAEIEDLTR